MDNKILFQIMVFYSLLSYFIVPYMGFYLAKEDGITYGIIVGPIISYYLWVNYGKKLAN